MGEAKLGCDDDRIMSLRMAGHVSYGSKSGGNLYDDCGGQDRGNGVPVGGYGRGPLSGAQAKRPVRVTSPAAVGRERQLSQQAEIGYCIAAEYEKCSLAERSKSVLHQHCGSGKWPRPFQHVQTYYQTASRAAGPSTIIIGQPREQRSTRLSMP